MIVHVSIGVRDLNRSRGFYDAALAPLGYKCIRAARSLAGYGYGADSIRSGLFPPSGQFRQMKSRVCTSALRRRMPRPSMRFMLRRCAQADGTTVRPVCGRCMTPITTPPSSLTRTNTGSKLTTAPAKSEG
jgi:hypothetical protein